MSMEGITPVEGANPVNKDLCKGLPTAGTKLTFLAGTLGPRSLEAERDLEGLRRRSTIKSLCIFGRGWVVFLAYAPGADCSEGSVPCLTLISCTGNETFGGESGGVLYKPV